MTTILESLSSLGLGFDERGERCIARIERYTDTTTGKQRTRVPHSTLERDGDKDVEGLADAYFTTALYRKGAIQKDKGRTTENCVAIQELVFDADLKDYLNRPAKELWELPQEEIDGHIERLVKDAQDVFERSGISIHRIVYSGYGIALYVRVNRDDQHRCVELEALHRSLTRLANSHFGSVIIDIGSGSPSTRLTRIPGTDNTKGIEPRRVRVIAEYPGTVSLDDFDVELGSIASPPSTAPPQTLTNSALDDIVFALSRGYGEGNRNAVALGIAGMFFNAGVSREQCLEVIERVAEDDEELDNRLNAVHRTYNKGERDEPVAGYHDLIQWLPVDILSVLKQHLHRVQEVKVTVGGTRKTKESQADHQLLAFPDECYYGWFGAYRDLMAPCTSAADAYHLAAALVYAGATAGRRVWLRHARIQYPNLSVVLVGETGKAKKDTAADFAQEFFDEQETARGTVISMTPYRTLFGLSTAEGLLQDMEKSGANVVVHTSEFNLLMKKGRSESSGTLLPTLTKLWDGLSYIDLPTRKDPIRVTKPVFSLLGTTTPHTLVRDMRVEDIESGFANRLLWVFGEGKDYIPRPPAPDAVERRRLLAEFLNALDTAEQHSPEFSLDKAAQSLWDDWGYALDATINAYINPDDRNMAQRIEANVARISTLFAATEGTPVISLAALEAAIAFVTTSFENIRYQSRMWGATNDAQIESRMLQIVRKSDVTPTMLTLEVAPREGTIMVKRIYDSMIAMGRLTVDAETGFVRAA